MLSACGVRIEQVTEPHPIGGWQQARCDRVARLLAGPDSWHPDQYNNPDNVGAYRACPGTAGPTRTGRRTVCSVGTGGFSAGVARVLQETQPRHGTDRGGHRRSTISGSPPTLS